MNIDSTTFSKIMGPSQSSPAITDPGLVSPTLPSTGGKSFDELLKQVKERPTASLNKAHLSDSATPRVGESPAEFLNRAKLSPRSGQNTPFSVNTAPLPTTSAPLPGDSSFSINTAVAPAPATPLPGDPSFSINAAALPSPATLPADNSATSPSPEDAAARHTQIQKAAEGLISNALILPMLKQLRHSSLGENTIFSGGNGEKMFGPEFDMELSDRIAKSPRLGAKNALVARLERKSTAPKTAAADLKKTSTPRIDVNA